MRSRNSLFAGAFLFGLALPLVSAPECLAFPAPKPVTECEICRKALADCDPEAKRLLAACFVDKGIISASQQFCIVEGITNRLIEIKSADDLPFITPDFVKKFDQCLARQPRTKDEAVLKFTEERFNDCSAKSQKRYFSCIAPFDCEPLCPEEQDSANTLPPLPSASPVSTPAILQLSR